MNKGNQTGITLIALIITIIVILILVAVSVSTISQSGLFDHAKDATNKWADEQDKEANIGDEVDRLIDEHVNKYYIDTTYYEHNVVLKNKENDKETVFQKVYIKLNGETIEITDYMVNASEHFFIEEGEEDYNYVDMYDVACMLEESGYLQNYNDIENTKQEITIIKDGISYTGIVTVSVCDL